MAILPMILRSCSLCFQNSKIKLKSLLKNYYKKKIVALDNSLVKAKNVTVI